MARFINRYGKRQTIYAKRLDEWYNFIKGRRSLLWNVYQFVCCIIENCLFMRWYHTKEKDRWSIKQHIFAVMVIFYLYAQGQTFNSIDTQKNQKLRQILKHLHHIRLDIHLRKTTMHKQKMYIPCVKFWGIVIFLWQKCIWKI